MVKNFRRYLYSFWRNSRTWQTHRQTDRQTDRRTDTAWQHRPRLCVASLGKNVQRKSCEFRFIRGFYVCISIQNILKGNLQPKCKGASVWPMSTAVITHSLTAALDQLRVVASSTSNDPGPRSRQHQQITAVITGVIFTCPGRAGPVFRLDRGLTYFARIALRAAQHAMEPYIRSESRFTDGHTLDTLLKLTTSTMW